MESIRMAAQRNLAETASDATDPCYVDSQIILQMLVELHDRCLIPASVAVVRRTEYCHHVLRVRPVESLLKSTRGRQQRQTSASSPGQDKEALVQDGVVCTPLFLQGRGWVLPYNGCSGGFRGKRREPEKTYCSHEALIK